MLRPDIGTILLAARKAAGMSQSDVAERMGSRFPAVSRVETGRSAPTVEFVERYARAVGRPISVTFGEIATPTWEDRIEYARWVYHGWLVFRRVRWFPHSADLILRRWSELRPEDLYLRLLDYTARRLAERPPYQDLFENPDARGPVAVAAMYHDVVDWRIVRRSVPDGRRLLDRSARRKARETLAGPPWPPVSIRSLSHRFNLPKRHEAVPPISRYPL